MSTLRPKVSAAGHAEFFEELEAAVLAHPVMTHPFLQRISSEELSREQLRAFAGQHYLYSRRFANNLAAVISNAPDEHARTLLVLNMYEEIGEPSRLRDRVHLILLEEGLITGAQLGEALERGVNGGAPQDPVAALIDSNVVSRAQVAAVMERSTRRAKDLTHPALFRRFLTALDFDPASLRELEPIEATEQFNAAYRTLCRDSHWLEGLATMGPGTECIVPALYRKILEGIRRSGLVAPADYVFWTVHVHCDDGHGRNIIEAMQPYAGELEARQSMMRGALGALDARQSWFDGLYGHVFGAVREPRVSSARLRAVDGVMPEGCERHEAGGT
ncbi:MAG TPA: iron-containing redox enzyme family protein [Polyangiaceae bacterium]|nr:iron-containing redox enzyme family protein [Polyangiaceae bacterium]